MPGNRRKNKGSMSPSWTEIKKLKGNAQFIKNTIFGLREKNDSSTLKSFVKYQ